MLAPLTYLMGETFQVVFHEMTAVRSIEDWETPRIPESYEMRFFREEINIKYAETTDLLSGHL